MQWFWIGCAGALLHEASRWVGLRRNARLPRYMFRLHYWLLTLVFIALGGAAAFLLEPQRAAQALCIGLATPSILSRLERFFPERIELGQGEAEGPDLRDWLRA